MKILGQKYLDSKFVTILMSLVTVFALIGVSFRFNNCVLGFRMT